MLAAEDDFIIEPDNRGPAGTQLGVNDRISAAIIRLLCPHHWPGRLTTMTGQQTIGYVAEPKINYDSAMSINNLNRLCIVT